MSDNGLKIKDGGVFLPGGRFTICKLAGPAWPGFVLRFRVLRRLWLRHSRVVGQVLAPNLVTDEGKQLVADLLADTGGVAVPGWISISNDTTAVAVTDTGAGWSGELSRQAQTARYRSGKIFVISAWFGKGVGTGTINRVGVLNASSGGTLLAEALVSPGEVKGATDTYFITYETPVA